MGLVHRRQERADLHDDRAARHAPVCGATRREVGLRIQHRHPGLCRGARVRCAARRADPDAHHAPPENERHILLRSAGSGTAPGDGLRQRLDESRVSRSRRATRSGELRRRSTQELRGRGGTDLDSPGLCAFSPDAAQWRRARWRAHPRPPHGRSDDTQSGRHAIRLDRRARIWFRFWNHRTLRRDRNDLSRNIQLGRGLR